MAEDQIACLTKKIQQIQQLYICPLTLQLMKEPFILKCGHTFEEQNIKAWLNTKRICPLCSTFTTYSNGIKNLAAKQSITILKTKFIRKKPIKKTNIVSNIIIAPKIDIKQNFQIFIRINDSRTITIQVNSDNNSIDVCDKISQKTKCFYEINRIRLVYGGKQLQWPKYRQIALKQFNIQKGSTISMF